jgi:aspartyl-tRNA(Asn)/glutamyl-tRNA(Gln) amidotransferase subunit C
MRSMKYSKILVIELTLITLSLRKGSPMIDKKTIEHIGKLARLSVSDQEAEQLSQQLSKALNYFEQISKLDTANIEPMVTPSQMTTVWRADQVQQEHTAEEMVRNAPSRAGHLFKVPPVV